GGSPRAGGRKGGSPFLKSQRGSRAPGKLGNLEIAPLSHPAFRILNDAVTFPTDRPLKVVGEAGSGKTLAIVRRFEHLIQEGLAPAHILVVVPSPLATHRLHQLLVTANEPPAPPRPPNIGTVGQHCERFLSQWAEQGVPVTMKTLATPADRRFLFRQALQDVLYLRQGSGNYLRACRHLDFAALASWTVPLQQFIESLKDLGITPDDFEAQARAGHRSTYERLRQALREVLAVESLAPGAKRALKTRLTQWLPPQAAEEEEFIGFLAAVYRAYQTALRQAGLGEDADLVAEVERVFRERPDLQTQVREEVRYLLVDDWHNSTPMHWRWLRLFAADERLSNVTVTGNPQQRLVTGEFDGLAAFTAEAWGGKTVPLSVSLRCPAPILAAARYEGRGTKDEGRGESSSLDLQSSSPAPVIHLIEAPSPEDEATALATEVKRLIEARQPPEGLAILLRSLRHAPRYERALRAIGVPVNVAGGLGEQYAWQQVLAYLRLLADPSDDLAALTVLTGPPWQGDDETLTRQYVTTSTRQRPNTPQGWWREVLAGQPALRQCWEKLMTLQGKPDWDERVTLLMEITGLRAHWHTLPSPLREQALTAAERLLAW
ncbi:MAG TPA: ATP-dependent helicase, partial [Armatimonadetes bacterium]|nr:ATP-dependent helicase [Armatimonadota bacterium]